MSAADSRLADRLTPELVARFPRPGMAIPGHIEFSPDSAFITYLFSDRGDLVRHLWRLDLATGRTHHWLAPPGGGATDENLSPDEALRRERLRLRETGITDYAWAKKANVLILPIGGDLHRWRDGELVCLATGGVSDAKVVDDGTRVFFVRDGDVWCVDDQGERPLTSGSSPGVRNGQAEFVAQEELDRMSGYWPSPDGDLVAYAEVDERHIPVYPIVHQGSPKLEIEEHRYPFAGAANAKVRIGVVTARGGEPVWLDLGQEEGYVSRVDWHPDGRLFLQWLARDWRRLELRAYDVGTGRSHAILVETQEPWINLHNDLRVVESTGEFTWSSERSGFRHLQMHGSDGTLLRQLTAGDWLVDATVALDGERRQLYFLGWRQTPVERHLFRVSLDGGDPEPLTREAGIHGAEVAPDFSSFVDVSDSRSQPPGVTVRGLDGAVRHVIHEPSSGGLDVDPPELRTFLARDGVELHAAVYRPAGQGIAPVIVSVYGGPGPQMVNDSWAETVDLRARMLAEHGFIVLKVDNRGSARRGLNFEAPIAGRLGDIEVRDQVDGVYWLAGLGLGDVSRVGIYGWSYGGYMTLMTMLKEPELFKVGVAGAPVTFMDGYDTAYTEKYMRLPQANPEGYWQSSVLSHTAGLQGKLLLIHGMIDENVHFRHTARLMQSLIDAGKPFETLLYPNERHMPRSETDRADMERHILEFFQRHL